MNKKAYCEKCNAYVDYTKHTGEIKEVVDGINIEYRGTKTYCKQCGAEVLIEKYDDENTMKAHAIYKEKKNKRKCEK